MTTAMAGGAQFGEWLGAHRDELEGLLASAFERPRGDELSRYLYGPLAAYSANGGKRVRPLICLLACEAVGGDASRARVTAAAIEHFQTAALIHDDIADEGELRRGEPCLHRTVGEGLAINCGDTALVDVFGTVAADDSLEPGVRVRVLAELHAMALRTLEGQALDLGWARDGRWDVTPEGYLRMATLKTAHYSCAVPLALGALVGGGTSEQVEGLRSFGLDAGLAFQLQDDLLNLVGDAEAQGKDFRTDVTEGKRTLAAVWALAHAGEAESAELQRILASHAEDGATLARAVDIMEGCGAIGHVRGYAHELVGCAKGKLQGLGLEPRHEALLASMADFFVERLG